jgi:hypothetical protein
MGSMPNWFAKTKEMAAFDRYFSMVDVDEQTLQDRYLQALHRLLGQKYFVQSDALDNEWALRPNRDRDLKLSLDGHFRGDWVHHLYARDPTRYGQIGGRFWPQVPSEDVLDRLQAGVIFAIHKALGDVELANMGLSQDYRDVLWTAERENEIPVDDGIRPVAMSWNCVAPAGENFFEVDALRGPTVVEFAIATPRPYGHSVVAGLADDFRDHELDLGQGGVEG